MRVIFSAVPPQAAKFTPCLKSDPTDCKYGLSNGNFKAWAAITKVQINRLFKKHVNT
jgi:hypothetical protein